MLDYYSLPKQVTFPLKIFLCFLVLTILFILSYFIIFSNSLPYITVPFLLITLIVCIIRFDWGILLFIFLIPLLTLLPSQLGVPNFSLIEIVFLIMIIVWFGRLIRMKEVPLIKTPLDFPLLIFFLIIISSCIVTIFSLHYLLGKIIFYELIESLKNIFIWNQEDRFFTLRGALTLTEGILLYFLIVNNVKTKEMVKKIVATAILSSGAVGAYGIFQYFTGFQLLEFWVRANPYLRRINSTMADVNSFGAYLTLILPLIIALTLIIGKNVKLTLIALAMGLVFCLVFSNSRSSWIGFFGALIFFITIAYRNKLYLFYKNKFIRTHFKKILCVGISLFLICFVFLMIISKSYKIESKAMIDSPMKLVFYTLNPRNTLDVISKGRLSTYWKAGIEMIKDYPFFGIGVGSFVSHFLDYKDVIKLSYRPENAHNYFIQIGAEIGLIGLAIFLCLIIIIFRYGFIVLKRLKEEYWKFVSLGILAGIAGFLISCLAQHPLLLIEMQFIFWLFVSTIFILGGLNKIQLSRLKLSKKLLLIIVFAILASIPFRLFFPSNNKVITNHGFYYWERWQHQIPFRWTKRTASQQIEINGSTLYLPILSSQPNISNKPVKIDIYFDGYKIDSIILKENKWRILNYPIIDNFDKNLIISFILNRTWNPLKSGFNKDGRDIGIGVGEIWWDRIPSYFKSLNLQEEYGFYDWEIYNDEFKFRWSKKRAYISLTPEGERIFIPMMCNKPDIKKNPQKVRVCLNNFLMKEVILNDTNWKTLMFNLGKTENKEILITLEVMQTWKPSAFGLSSDKRELGVAVGPISWENNETTPGS